MNMTTEWSRVREVVTTPPNYQESDRGREAEGVRYLCSWCTPRGIRCCMWSYSTPAGSSSLTDHDGAARLAPPPTQDEVDLRVQPAVVLTHDDDAVQRAGPGPLAGDAARLQSTPVTCQCRQTDSDT